MDRKLLESASENIAAVLSYTNDLPEDQQPVVAYMTRPDGGYAFGYTEKLLYENLDKSLTGSVPIGHSRTRHFSQDARAWLGANEVMMRAAVLERMVREKGIDLEAHGYDDLFFYDEDQIFDVVDREIFFPKAEWEKEISSLRKDANVSTNILVTLKEVDGVLEGACECFLKHNGKYPSTFGGEKIFKRPIENEADIQALVSEAAAYAFPGIRSEKTREAIAKRLGQDASIVEIKPEGIAQTSEIEPNYAVVEKKGCLSRIREFFQKLVRDNTQDCESVPSP